MIDAVDAFEGVANEDAELLIERLTTRSSLDPQHKKLRIS